VRVAADVAEGDLIDPVTFPVRRADLVAYAGASGDYNVIHWSTRAAIAVGLPDVIAHGMLTMALAGRVATDWAGDPGAILDYAVRFTRPVVVPDDDDGTDLVVAGRVESVDSNARTATVVLTATVADAGVLSGARAVLQLT
jgi:acyl dehydratase